MYVSYVNLFAVVTELNIHIVSNDLLKMDSECSILCEKMKKKISRKFAATSSSASRKTLRDETIMKVERVNLKSPRKNDSNVLPDLKLKLIDDSLLDTIVYVHHMPSCARCN